MKPVFKKVAATLMATLGLLSATVPFQKVVGAQEDLGDFSGQTLKVGLWGGSDQEEKTLDALIKKFEEKTHATVEKKVYTDYNTQIQADMVGRTAPDVYYVDMSMLPFFVEQGGLAELDASKFQTDKFYSSIIDAFSRDGKLYAVPKDFSTLAMYLNTGMFEKAGVSVDEVPDSFEELLKWLPEFQAKLDKAYGPGKVKAISYNQDLARNLHIAERGGANPVTEDNRSNLQDNAVVENLNFYKQLVDTGAAATPKEVGTGWNGEAFGTEKVAIMDEGNWVYQLLKQQYSDVKFKVKEMPTYKGQKGSMMFSVGWGKYSGTKNSELADAWIRYITGAEAMKEWVEGTGTLPSRQDVAEEAKITSNQDLNMHIKAWEYATPWQKGPSLSTIANAYMNFLPKALDGSETLEDAMKHADEQANTDIDAGN